MITAILIISFSLNIQSINNDAVATFYSPQTRFWELMAGGLLAWITLAKVREKKLIFFLKPYSIYLGKLNQKNVSNMLSIIGVTLLTYGFFNINKQMNFPGIWALIPVISAILIIYAGPQAWFNKIILSNRIVVWFGLISFPLYLWHWIVLSFFRQVEIDSLSPEIRIIIIGISIFLSWITYKYVEQPIRFGKHKRIKVYVLISLMFLVFSVGYFTYKEDGLKYRNINILNKNIDSALSYNWKDGYRFGKCFLEGMDEDSRTFSSICSPILKEKKSLLIWGDSHAASLYQGFQLNSKKYEFNLAQYTTSGCPPILDFQVSNRKECENINSSVLQKIQELKPDTVVMAGYWSMYNGLNGWEELDFIKLELTIKKLKSLDVKHIVLVGSLPVYTVNQVDMLRRRFEWENIPLRTYKNFNSSAFELDEQIGLTAKKSGIDFISPLKLLCDETGCLISVSSNDLEPLSWDYGHLTSTGSIYLVSKFFNNNLINHTK